jgi:periplasmic protein CpxP/Spy
MSKEHKSITKKMKKLILIVMALGAMQVTAQEQRREHKQRDKQERSQRFKDFTPEQIAELQTKKMALILDLTEAQQRDIKKIHLANAKGRQAKREEQKLKREKNNGEKRSKDERFNLMNERLEKQISNKKEMKRILSQKQFEKFEKNQNLKQRKGQAHKQKKGKPKKQDRKKF